MRVENFGALRNDVGMKYSLCVFLGFFFFYLSVRGFISKRSKWFCCNKQEEEEGEGGEVNHLV